MRPIALMIVTLLLAAAFPALANDSEAEYALGGLTLKQSKHISMDSEDLYISAKQVRVKYRFTNNSAKDISTLISFPLPTLPESLNSDDFYQKTPDFDALKFETKVNGKLAPLTKITRAMIDDRDVTEKVKARGYPVNWIGDDKFLSGINAMDDAQRKPLIDAGLVKPTSNFDWTWVPTWKVARHITRKQVFPAGKTVSVEHSYEPLVGGSVGGALNKSIRAEYPEALAEYKKRYCVDDFFLRGIDRRQAKAKPGKLLVHTESWIGYILSSGANWKGPIKNFRLVIDKGDAKNLVSFCMDGVKKISPTRFEVRKTNFEPKQDLNILILHWYEVDG